MLLQWVLSVAKLHRFSTDLVRIYQSLDRAALPHLFATDAIRERARAEDERRRLGAPYPSLPLSAADHFLIKLKPSGVWVYRVFVLHRAGVGMVCIRPASHSAPVFTACHLTSLPALWCVVGCIAPAARACSTAAPVPKQLSAAGTIETH